jgi:hypothetical protein
MINHPMACGAGYRILLFAACLPGYELPPPGLQAGYYQNWKQGQVFCDALFTGPIKGEEKFLYQWQNMV